MVEENEKKVRFCPFLKEYCIGERCTVNVTLTRRTGTTLKQARVCAFEALVVLISELNTKTRIEKPDIERMIIPPLIRG